MPMPTDVIMPQMGESIFEGTLTKWLKKPGDKVTRDEPLFEISTDKVDAEIPAPASGVLSEIKVPAGQTVQVNSVVGVIGGAAGPATSAPTAVPTDGRKGQTARAGGDVSQQRAGEEETEIPTTLRGRADVEPAARAQERQAVARQGEQVIQFPAHDRTANGQRIRSSPLVRRIAREQNIDLGNVPGTGLGGRISKNDILGYVQGHGAGAPARAQATTPAIASPTPATRPAAPATHVPAVGAVPGDLVPMSTMRKKIAARHHRPRRAGTRQEATAR